MNTDTPYSNREINEKFNDIIVRLDRIELQTTKTNGNVIGLKLWRAWITGALAVVSVVVLPILGYLAYQVVHPKGTLAASINQVETSIQQLQSNSTTQK